jgi:hypothetical protein
MNDDPVATPYTDLEFLSVDGLHPMDGGPVRVGISFVIADDGEPIDVSLSPDDAERLIIALAKAVYDVREK